MVGGDDGAEGGGDEKFDKSSKLTSSEMLAFEFSDSGS